MLRNVTGGARVRQLQLATGGRYKPYLVEKIVKQLKDNFLEEKKKKLTLKELVALIEEKELSDDILVWLAEEALPNHPRVIIVKNSDCGGVLDFKFMYKPPLKISNKGSLLKLLKERSEKPASGDNKEDEIGLLKSVVLDSISVGQRIIEELLNEEKILEITRLDRQTVLFYKKPDAELDKFNVDDCFIDLWRNVDVSNKEMTHIREYLKNRGLPIFKYEMEEDNKDVAENKEMEAGVGTSEAQGGVHKQQKIKKATKRKAPKGKKSSAKPEPKKQLRRSTRIKDNVHVKDDLMHIDLD